MAYSAIWVPLAIAATNIGHQERVAQEQKTRQGRQQKAQKVQQDASLAQQQRAQQQAAADQQRATSQAPDIAALLASAASQRTGLDTQLGGGVAPGNQPIGGRTSLG